MTKPINKLLTISAGASVVGASSLAAAEYIRQGTIAMAAGRAAVVKAELMDCADNMVRDRASSCVLGTAGIGPATAPAPNFNIEIKAGYVIDLTDQPPAPRVIPHE